MTTGEDGEVLRENIARAIYSSSSIAKFAWDILPEEIKDHWRVYADAVLALIEPVMEENERLRLLINTPEVDDWAKGVVLEAGHQRERWGVDHDAGKSPFDWFWLIGYLAQKAASSAVAGDTEKAKHHTISTGAALANWHLALSGVDTHMRAGIGPNNGGEKPGSAYQLASKLDHTA